MLKFSPRVVIATGLATVCAVAVPTLAASGGGGTPANKAVAAGSHRVVFDPATATPLMSATFRTSKPEDLLLTVSLECTILTSLTTNNANSTSTARAGIDVWIQDENGKVVPISDTSAPPQDPANNGNGDATKDGVTFCDREYSRTVTNQENDNGIDQISDYIRTKSSHAFSWVRLNAGAGIHTYTVFANLREAVTTGSGDAQAEVGNRTFVIEPTKLANDAAIAENGTS
jgi:hypothetical protein